MAESGSYVIDPDGEGGLLPYNVICDMSDKGGVGVTVISHDSENRTLVDECERAGCYLRDINYTGASFPQLASLTRVSLHCEQQVTYECFNSRMFRDEDFATWISRDSKMMRYWHGAGTESGKCACGMNNTCAIKEYGCNCDANDKQWRADSGLLSSKSHLPVKQLRFGDVGSWKQSNGEELDEQGYHALGKFKCYGKL